MSFSPSEFNWQLILIIVSISAVVSYVGDVLGMRIGKRRISLLGLRPRYTSTVITLFTGVGVALLTLVVASYASDTIRMAMFGQNYLERQIASLTRDLSERQNQLYDMEFEVMGVREDLESMEESMIAVSGDLRSATEKLRATEEQARILERERSGLSDELDALKAEKIQTENDVLRLRAETEQLKKGLSEMKRERVVALQGELLAQTFVEPQPEGGAVTGEMVDSAMENLIRAAESYLSEKVSGAAGGMSYARPVGPITVMITDDVRRTVASQLASSGERRALRLTALSNAVEGQAVEGLVSVFGSRRIFRGDEVLLEEVISGGLGQDNTADILYTLLKQINGRAVALGVMPDPLTGNVGNLGSVEFFDSVDRINESEGRRVVRFLAATDIYTEGPVNLRIDIEEGE
ncbi:MAG: DUF3084 domain-containing protein [Synergistaceae bacterium]|nr:DUF3084 domain-containing protein [Synergistaceae bacterium]